MLPIRDSYSNVFAWDPENPPPEGTRPGLAEHRAVLPGYFEAMDIPILAGRDVEDNDVTTPNEMSRLLEMIVDGEAAGRESCDEILAIMGKCQTGQYRIPKYLPTKKLVLQRKTGSLPGIRNDVAVVTVKETGERFVISCFTMGAEDVYEAALAKAIRQRARQDPVFSRYLDRKSKTLEGAIKRRAEQMAPEADSDDRQAPADY